MKKLLYTLMFVLFSGIAFTSCTEEEVKPTEAVSNGGGGPSGDLFK